MTRKPVSKRMRFNVFKRDNFTCQYCSAKPPKVPLEIDHIIPVSKNGKNRMDNLITACFDCNRGKSNIELDVVPTPLYDKIEEKTLAQQQYLQYKKLLKKADKIINDDINIVELIYSSYFDGYVFTNRFRNTVKNFIEKIGIEETKESMYSACSKIYCEQQVLRYFCGICWNKIRDEKYNF